MNALKQSQNSKQLKTKLAKLEAEYKACQGEIAILQRRNSTLQRDIEALTIEINSLENDNKEPVITEHALVRYFERVQGFNLEDVAKLILPEETKKLIKAFGSGKFPADGFRVVVKDKVVVTIEV